MAGVNDPRLPPHLEDRAEPRRSNSQGKVSWLNIAEIELGVLARQCLDRRIPSQRVLARKPEHSRSNATGRR